MSGSSKGVAGAAVAGLWSAADLLLRHGAQFGVSLVLARLLSPADFGLVALMTFFSTLVTVLVQNGITTALIQRQNTSLRQESAVFWFNLAVSTTLALLILALSGPIASFYEQPLLQSLLYVSAATVIVSSLGAVHGALLNRELQFAAIMKIGGVATGISGVIAVLLAYGGYGVWSLAIMALVAALLNTTGCWVAYRWKPLLALRADALGSLLGYGAWISLSGFLDVLYTQGFSLLIGKLHGVREVGLFNRGASTQQLPGMIISQLVSRVALPLFSARADEPEAIKRGARMAIGFAMLLNVPVMVGLALCAPLVIEVLYGAKWLASAPILAILAIGGIVLPLHFINIQITLAIGLSKLFFKVEIIKKSFCIGCIIIGSMFSIEGLAWAQVMSNVIALWLNAYPASRKLGYSCSLQLFDLRGLVIPTCAMVATVTALQATVTLPGFLKLATLVCSGGLVYFATGLALRCLIFLEAAQMGLGLMRKRAGSADPQGSV